MGAERECPPFHPPSQTEAARLITDFLASVFSVDVPEWREKWYKLTTAVTEILTADKNIDGLMYPTIPMSARADNVVLKPESVSMGLAFERVKYELVRKIEGLTVNADVLDYAGTISDSGRLDWKGRQEKWVLKKQGDALRMTVDEHGEYVARDSSGNILEPE